MKEQDIIKDFENYFKENKHIFQKWGDFVADEIKNQLRQKISPQPIEQFLKIEVKPRVKQLASALAKIGRKNYQNPVSEMTDLVGVRFVVLLTEQIDIVCEIIQKSQNWNWKVSKDFQDEIESNPKFFDYQSKHYEIRPKDKFKIDNDIISQDICCEVQVRSILQHAYAELVHDNIYKPQGNVPKQAEREVAKSMALMETTDSLFSGTLKLLKECNQFEKELFNKLKKIYITINDNQTTINEKINLIVISSMKDIITQDIDIVNEIKKLTDEIKYISQYIQQRSNEIFLYQQPIILLIYYLTKKHGATEVQNKWELPAYLRQLGYVFSDLGTQP